MVGLTLAGMTTSTSEAITVVDRSGVEAGVFQVWSGAPQSPSSIDQAVRYTDEQIDSLNRLSAALLEKLGPVLAEHETDGRDEPTTRDRLTPLVRSQHAVSIAELGDRLAHLVDVLRDALGRVDL